MMVVVLSTTVSILIYEQRATVRAMTEAQEESARNLVNTVALSVESQYQSILFHKSASMEKRKAVLRSVLELAMVHVEMAYEESQTGAISEEAAKQRAISTLKRMRYDNGVGYLWINTTDRPTPKMIMHPVTPELDGQVLDAPQFNCALGRDENLFRAMVDICLQDGQGYVDYLWPKPTEEGTTDRQPKLSYVQLFEPWGWVVGTGLYIDDIERDAEERLQAALKELQVMFSHVKVAQTGYMFLFTGQQEMLIHPYLAGADFSVLLNPATGNPMLEDLMAAAHSPSNKVLYIWDKPPDFAGQFRFSKMAFVKYFEPFDWYIASSAYHDEMEQPAEIVRWRVMMLGGVLLLASLVLSLWLSRSLTKPLLQLSRAARNIRGQSVAQDKVPVSGTFETRELGEVLNGMLSSLSQDEIAERRQTESTLKNALQEKEVLLREVHHRVKNNLAVVVSLLSMQAKRMNDEQVRVALEESRSRIAAMSLIHENLYRSESLAEIPLKEYVAALYSSLQQAMMQGPGGIALSMGGLPVSLSMEQAVPCGLVLNELITNSLKYAYPEGGPGAIRIEAAVTPGNRLQLDYFDDGIGLPEDFDPATTNSLGMRIVTLLVENQLGGTLAWEIQKGAHFTLCWPINGPQEEMG